ncbi:MAG: hypothetical protein H0V94_01970, partial [Actinobacteria bacterium]|nr:hypothetical protein [Actinomycetota bacterium]
GKGQDGYVSLEVDPTLAYDRESTFEQAQRLKAEVDRPNLLVKIPATRPGLGAIEDCIAKGTSINVTLIFSLERYKAVVEAYIRGLERLVAGGGDPAPVASVASFFVSRVDTEADRRLEERGNTELQGKLAIANAKLAYQHYLAAFSGPRWEFLAAKGATRQRCLWASTSTKNPAYRDVLYVEELIGPETVNTMPAETIVAFQDHGKVKQDSLAKDIEAAEQLLADLRKAKVDYDDVVETLEAADVGLDDRLVALEREDQRDVDRLALRDRVLDRAQSGLGRGDLDEQVRPVDVLVQAHRLLERALTVVGERGVDLERDVAVQPFAAIPDGAKQVARALDVLDRKLEEDLSWIVLPLRDLRELLVVPDPLGHRLLEDRRVRGDADDGVLLDEACQLPCLQHLA